MLPASRTEGHFFSIPLVVGLRLGQSANTEQSKSYCLDLAIFKEENVKVQLS